MCRMATHHGDSDATGRALSVRAFGRGASRTSLEETFLEWSTPGLAEISSTFGASCVERFLLMFDEDL